MKLLVGIGMATGGVLRENEYSETRVRNLFAAGNVVGRGGSFGFTWGCLIADHVVELVKTTSLEGLGVDVAILKRHTPLEDT